MKFAAPGRTQSPAQLPPPVSPTGGFLFPRDLKVLSLFASFPHEICQFFYCQAV